MAKAGIAKQVGWDEDNVSSAGYAEKPDRYKAKKGLTDTLRIMSFPRSFYGANVSADDGKGFFAVSLADHDDSLAAEQGDSAALARCVKACPLYERGFDIKRRFVLLVVHVARSNGKKTQKVMRPYPWVIDGAKYNQIKAIAQMLPTVKTKSGPQQLPLNRIEIKVNCEDTTFQKTSFLPAIEKSQWLSDYASCLEVCKDSLDDPADPNSECDLVQPYIDPEAKMHLIASIKRVMGGGHDDDGLVERDTGNAKPKKGGGKKSKPEDAFDDADIEAELDSVLDDFGSEESTTEDGGSDDEFDL